MVWGLPYSLAVFLSVWFWSAYVFDLLCFLLIDVLIGLVRVYACARLVCGICYLLLLI